MIATGHRFRLFNCMRIERCHQLNLIAMRNYARFYIPGENVLRVRLLNAGIIIAYRLHIPTESELTGID